MGRIRNGRAITVFAIDPMGKVRVYDSMTKAALNEGYSMQFVHREVRKNVLRPYQSKDPSKRGIRFTTDQVFARLLSERNEEYLASYRFG